MFVSLGDATLVIRDNTDDALAHWSLPAIERLNPGERPALYAPASDAEESLEIDDETMIEAIRTVQRAVLRTRPKRGFLRRGVFLASAGLLVALGMLWLPDALVRHTAAVLPAATRADIGLRLLVALEPLTGRPCSNPTGLKALKRLQSKLFDAEPWAIAVLPGGPAASAALPGGVLVARKSLIDPQPGADALAGALMVEAARAKAEDPMQDLLRHAGVWQTLHLLTRGEIGDDAIRDYAEAALIRPRSEPPLNDTITRFVAADISTLPYVRTLPADGWSESLAAADPADEGRADPLLSDANWLRVQTICE